MKQIILFFLVLLFPLVAKANMELVTGGVTYHLVNGQVTGKQFSNKISEDGDLIATPALGVTFMDEESFPGEYTSLTAFAASNSVGEPAAGVMFETGEVFAKRLQIGLAFGGYLQDDREFRRRGIAPFVIAEVNNIGLAPVGGLAVNYKVDLFGDYYLRFNNILTPVITNHTVSFGKDF